MATNWSSAALVVRQRQRPMATKTRAELGVKALGNLGIVESGQPPSSEDAETVNGYVDGLIDGLSARGIVSITDDNAIPAEFFLPLAVLLADVAANDFGLPGVPATQSNPNPVSKAEYDIRLMTRSQPTGEPQTTEYF
jgi:hypothetical protein